MKVIFTAFKEQLFSKPIELPENTTDRFYMPMPMDVLKASPKMDGSMVPDKPIMKKGTFQKTGKSWFLQDWGYDEEGFAEEYVLVDIS